MNTQNDKTPPAERTEGSLERACWTAEDSERMRKAVGRLNAWRTKWAMSSQDLAEIQSEFFIMACKLTGEPSSAQAQRPG